MTHQNNIDYVRIEKAIHYIVENKLSQPSLEDVARHVHLSSHHLQKLFTEWAGVSPKKFLQYLTLEHAKGLLLHGRATLSDTAYEVGLSGTGRLHDLFISIERMTPGEYKKGGENLTISYSFSATPFGKIIVASTKKGVCHMAFLESEQLAFSHLISCFPNAEFMHVTDAFQRKALSFFHASRREKDKMKFHLYGTPFQIKVWESLLKIPFGRLSSYSHIAEHIGQANASRAVGTAISKNPIAFLIPCHRVIQRSGNIGGYAWGSTKKSAIIAWESAQLNYT